MILLHKHTRARTHTHTHTHMQSVGLPRTNEQPIAETSTKQQTTVPREGHPCPGGIRTRNPSKQAAADPLLRPRAHVDQPDYFLHE
jgi:hypothetical protein